MVSDDSLASGCSAAIALLIQYGSLVLLVVACIAAVIACFVVDAIELFIFAGRCICAYAALQVLMFGWNRFMNWCSTGRSANEGAAP